ncbi:hypothetical protein Acor_30610 [Acrocarpospora corrugata]|uniref:Uncharacterized protein n=1 Tax=Acrocarpospora corrugata TaxID=35763 RepID=A0A5M3VVZ4_9ACTN|nr:hypothetical protein [Acrocarpospora corrugata]GES00997.1 hypothetical protein Acor_30610 [Acrocarpospora corrugata]
MSKFVHVLPTDDVIPHEGTPDCVCGPYSQSIELRGNLTGQGPVAVLYRHYAVVPCRNWEASPEIM